MTDKEKEELRTFEPGTKLTRQFKVENGFDSDRVINVAFASNTPVLRSFGYEVLSTDPASVRLDRLENGGIPVLDNHDCDDLIGRVLEITFSEDGKLRAQLKFSQNGKAQKILLDIKDGLREGISVGYIVHSVESTGEMIDDLPVMRVTDWEIYEVSSVSIPADPNVGVNRSLPAQEELTTSTNKNNKEVRKMENTEVKQEPTFDVAAAKEEARKAEQSRIRALTQIGQKFQLSSDAERFIESGKSVEQFREHVLERMDASGHSDEIKQPSGDEGSIGMTQREVKSYNFMNVLRAAAHPDNRKLREAAAFELEASEAAEAKMDRAKRGSFVVPQDVLVAKTYGRRDFNIYQSSPLTATGPGAELVATDKVSFIDLLRNKMITYSLGARTMTGLVGDISIPRQDGASTAYWISEGSDETLSNPNTDQVALKPHTVGAAVDISRKLLLQSSVDAQSLVIDDLTQIVAIEMDRVAIYGTGVGAQPVGIVNTSGVQSGVGSPLVGWTTANKPTFEEIVQMEGAVESHNALMGALAYATNPTTKSNLKTTSKDSSNNYPIFIWENNEMNGYKAVSTNQLNEGDVLFGNWQDLVYGLWSGLDIMVNPYINSLSGAVRVTVFQDCDVAVRHSGSFVYGHN